MPAKLTPPWTRRHFAPIPFRGIAERILRPAFRGRGFRESAIFLKWEHIVGPRLAERTIPLKLSGARVLTIRVEPAFAIDLQYQQLTIIERIATVYGYRAVERLKVVQKPVHARQHERPFVPPSPSPEDRAEAKAMTKTIKDPDLRKSFENLGATIASARRTR